MASRRRFVASPWAVVLGASALLVIGGVTLLRAQEDGAEPTAAEEPAPSGERGTPFQLYASDEGAVTADQLVVGPVPAPTVEELASGQMTVERARATSAETQASVDNVAAWAEGDNGYEVHQAWAGYSAAMQAEAETRAAEYAAGLSGASELGVVP